MHEETMLRALHADGPAGDRAGPMALYGWLVGAWDVEVADSMADGSDRISRGEWHFGWVLEGRAIQDVFIVPPRGGRADAGAENRYGTTLRVYDPAPDTWRITWVNPVRQVFATMTARRQGEEIVQDGTDADGSAYRWVFFEMTRDAFRWRAETRTADGGWRLTVAFRARRRSGG